ncbi:Rz1-like lysis system protein LysC [Paracandidimonas soli]
MTLFGCASGQPPQVPELMVNQCPPVVPCVLQAASPRTNGDLNLTLEQTEADWARCAAQVDMIYSCQQKAKPDAQADRSS